MTKLTLFFKVSILPLLVAYGVVAMLENIIYHNPSISEPLGYYLALPFLKFSREDLVLTCITNSSYGKVFNQLGQKNDGTCSNGLPYLLKRVAASQGDTVEVKESGIFINGLYQPNSKQFNFAFGVNLEPLPIGWKYVLKANQFFVLGQSPHSLDSRYFGIVDKKDIYRKAILIFKTND